MSMKNIDINKKADYQAQLATFMQKYKDKKSELNWADDVFEESLIKEEMENFAKKVRGLKKILEQLEGDQQVA